MIDLAASVLQLLASDATDPRSTEYSVTDSSRFLIGPAVQVCPNGRAVYDLGAVSPRPRAAPNAGQIPSLGTRSEPCRKSGTDRQGHPPRGRQTRVAHPGPDQGRHHSPAFLTTPKPTAYHFPDHLNPHGFLLSADQPRLGFG